ncbi:cyclic di-GMP-binding protein [Rhodoferax lithotrophicus]|uniref:Cyclic di-GMP-binding protein n=1 Tax=Rhodoferax lithotrophicus TaxID=2798804 RepID=A0ABM7MH96_9BURK|nr:cellulose biosynthesis cyclic di-GMP-binding regulatory protein BcsB [Rhodoferax sp. MIZ03]BCO25529.1 cyclic di-GMP-binding protein [Rhodoferax sp. MIZ03]
MKAKNMNPPFEFFTVRRLSLGLTVLALAVSCSIFSSQVLAKTKTKTTKTKAVVEEVIDTTPAAMPKQRVVSLSFKQLGAWSSVNLKGTEGSRTLSFSVRSDEMVVGAKLKLFYDYSPALIPELSHLRILLNERVVSVEGLPQGKNLGNSRDIDLDPRQMTDINFLRFNLIGHYTRQCEDPFHSSLWLTLSDLGRLELTLAPKSMVNDLKYLPAPFFDKHDDATLKLPFVFASTPSAGTVKAAGIVASWFGIQAGNRGAQFPVSLNTLPDGNAVVFAQGTEKILGVESPPGPTLSVINHPTNPLAKLLLVTGSNDEEILRSARALALISNTLSGSSLAITKETEATPRKPYDAPAWVPTDRPVRFGEIARPEELRAQGWYPETIRVNYRVSPDVFTWRTPGVPLNLKYRYTRLPEHKASSLNVSLNNDFIHALPLNYAYKNPDEINRLNLAGSDNVSKRSDLLFIPPYAVGGRDQLQLGYFFDILKHGECQNMPPDNLVGAIDPESTMDFSAFPHYVAMPNLAYFSNIGFPFTRLADLSETAVVMPDRPNSQELGIYLTLMGRMGEATGYPVLRHALTTAADIDKMADRDVLVIGSANSQPLLGKWADKLPLVQINGERHVREPDVTWKPTYRWEQQDNQFTPLPKGDLNLSNSGDLTTLMAFESPMKAERSVVLVHADRPTDLQKITDVLTNTERVNTIKGDLVVFNEKDISHTKVSATYYIGALPFMNKLQWLFADHPLWVGLLVALVCVLLAIAAYRPLRKLFHRTAKVKL